MGTRGQVSPDLSTRLRLASRRLSRRVKRLIDLWVAVMIARRERQAANWALNYMSDRELKDIGFYRVSVGRGDGYAGHMSPADARAAFSVAHPLEEGMQ